MQSARPALSPPLQFNSHTSSTSSESASNAIWTQPSDVVSRPSLWLTARTPSSSARPLLPIIPAKHLHHTTEKMTSTSYIGASSYSSYLTVERIQQNYSNKTYYLLNISILPLVLLPVIKHTCIQEHQATRSFLTFTFSPNCQVSQIFKAEMIQVLSDGTI